MPLFYFISFYIHWFYFFISSNFTLFSPDFSFSFSSYFIPSPDSSYLLSTPLIPLILLSSYPHPFLSHAPPPPYSSSALPFLISPPLPSSPSLSLLFIRWRTCLTLSAIWAPNTTPSVRGDGTTYSGKGPYPTPSRPIPSRPYSILFYSILSRPTLSYPIPSHPILSHPIPSYPIPSYPTPSYPILSYPILSRSSRHETGTLSALLFCDN